ncbi:MAG: LysM peptidoglycan-binding domain-containing protein [Oscillospiraceae bacterium]|nr:LysM peptidoglycan-binding domain-containing protein [Oscillospiraceae bacterium]
MNKGIDVSTHQGVIDWKQVKSDNIEFAILRAGYGRELSQKDARFERNYAGCTENSIPSGAYWYSYALTADDAKREAEVCIKSVSGKKFDYPIYFDIEDKTQLGLSDKRLQVIATAFCSSMEAAGYWVGIYSYKSFLEYVFTSDFLKRYAVWVAHTGVKETDFKYEHGIWQYSHTGTVKGISADVDLNYSYEDYPTMMKKAGLNGYAKSAVPQYRKHTVSKNESLWEIAEKYLGNGTRYKEIKTLNNLKSDAIYVNQKLKIPMK